MGWFLGVCIVIELWALWQLIKAPFELIAPFTRGEKPSPLVIAKSVIAAGLIVAVVWWIPHVNALQGGASASAAPLAAPASLQQRMIGEWNCEATTVVENRMRVS
jgi:hypothetical protein